MDKEVESEIEFDFLNKNPDPLLNENNFFEDDEDEETREFLMLEQTLQQENDEEPLFNILRKQVEQISIAINEEQKQASPNGSLGKNEDEENLNSLNNFQSQPPSSTANPAIVLRQKKKISFHANTYETSHLDHNDHDPDMSGRYEVNRPLTIYIPNTKQDLNLLNHLTTLGHDIDNFKQQIQLMPSLCLGYLWKECSNLENNWRKRYFCMDRTSKLFMYFKSIKHYYKHKEPKDVICFEDIKNVYPDHSRNVRNVEKVSKYYANFFGTFKSRSIFIVKTNKKDFVLSTFSDELMRLWIDIISTGAGAYENFY